MPKCAFCQAHVEPTDKDYYICPVCKTVQEGKLQTHPYLYSAGDHAQLEAPHVPVRKN